MNMPKDRLLQQTRSTTSGARQTGSNADAQADTLLGQAIEEQADQASILDTSPVEAQYNAAVAVQVEAKHNQVERLEDRLENLIELQASSLQRTQVQQPGMFSLPGAQAKWQQRLQQQQKTMQRLLGRLEMVREIRDGMGVYAPRIEEMAARKLRAQQPELAAEWDEMQQAGRLYQILLRQQEHDKKQALERDLRAQLGRGVRLGLSQNGP